MAKSRAQRKAEQRKRRAQQQQNGGGQSAAQERTQKPESADVSEAELAERGVSLDDLKGEPAEPQAPAPSRAETAPSRAGTSADGEVEAQPDKITRRELKRQERERKEAAKASEERRKPREEPTERERGRVLGFLASCIAELRRVQWPNRETLIQASAVTLVFIAVAAAYLGVLDAGFNWLVKLVI